VSSGAVARWGKREAREDGEEGGEGGSAVVAAPGGADAQGRQVGERAHDEAAREGAEHVRGDEEGADALEDEVDADLGLRGRVDDARGELGLGEPAEEPGVERWVDGALEDHEGLAGEVGESELGAAGEAVGAGDDERPAALEQGADGEGVVVDREVEEADLERAVAQAGEDLGGVKVAGLEDDGRIELAQGAHGPGDEGRVPVFEITQANAPAGEVGERAGLRLGLGDRGEDAAGVGEQGGAGGGEADARVALEQPGVEVGLELGQLLAERRLGDRQAQGGAAEVELLGEGDDRAQVAELHDGSKCSRS
jgi:hypothetical protein